MSIDTKRIDETISKISICLKVAIKALERGGLSDQRGFGVFNSPDFWKRNTFTYNDYSFVQTFIKRGALIDYGETRPPMELWEEIEENQQWLSHYEISNIIDANIINITDRQERLYLQKLKSNEEILQKLLNDYGLDANFYIYSNYYYGNVNLYDENSFDYARFVFVIIVCVEFAYKLCEIFKEKIANFSLKFNANEVISKPPQKVKLKFRNKKGDKKTLYWVLCQLSEKQVIPLKDWKHIAEFLVENVEGFENNNPADIAGELSRVLYDPPKSKNQIEIPDGKE
ncbi:hypothetical protein [Runella zeae]|uniref:hypothetical protein n=1 Tax=Runella zeae TaxID=94255 RepID=UPI00235776B8|nr:hypothetical protein [Runella zeae]